jgi:hypothetical protein
MQTAQVFSLCSNFCASVIVPLTSLRISLRPRATQGTRVRIERDSCPRGHHSLLHLMPFQHHLRKAILTLTILRPLALMAAFMMTERPLAVGADVLAFTCLLHRPSTLKFSHTLEMMSSKISLSIKNNRRLAPPTQSLLLCGDGLLPSRASSLGPSTGIGRSPSQSACRHLL